MKAWRILGLVVTVLASWPATGWTQGTESTITGVVKDSSFACVGDMALSYTQRRADELTVDKL